MSGNGNQVPLAPSQRGPGTYPRASTPHRPECYLPAGATGPAYMQSASGGGQQSAQAALRVPPTPQPSAPPAPQQDMSKTTMAGHNYVSAPNTPQARQQFNNFTYRTAQHGTRPNTLPRQQQPYNILNAPTAAGHVGYIPTYAVPAHMIPPYQQQRSSTPGAFYQYMPQFMYGTPPSQYYYQSNTQQLPAANLSGGAAGTRSNPSTLVGPQAPAAPPAPATSLPQQQPAQHMHQPIPGIRPTQQKRPSQRIPIIDPATQQEILSELYTNEHVSVESSERQTPQPETSQSIVEEFNRRVTEAANQPTVVCESNLKTNYVSKNVDTVPITTSSNTILTQTNTITSINNNIVKTDILAVNESKSLGPDIAVETNETPVVSAISDSPVIVPKMPTNVKQLQKNSDQNMQTVVVDKNIPPSKPQKQKNKPVVPQSDEVELSEEYIVAEVLAPAEAHAPPSPPAPQPQRVREPRERRSEEKEKTKDADTHEKDTSSAGKPNGPTPVVISSVDSLTEAINQQTSQVSSAESTKKPSLKEPSPSQETVSEVIELSTEIEKACSEPLVVPVPVPTATLLSSIEKLARELPTVHEVTEGKEESSAIQAQAKLTQSLASCQRINQTDSNMKDINLNNKTTDTDTANGNTTELVTPETAKEDVNKNEKGVKNTKNSKKNKMANNDVNAKEAESFENGKIETDKISSVEHEEPSKDDEAAPKAPEAAEKPEPVKAAPKYQYRPEQWSPWNTTGKKCYDIGLLKQMKDDPKSKNKPEAPLLETLNVIRTAPMQESLNIAALPRPGNDGFLPQFANKTSGMAVRSSSARDPKKDGRGMVAMSGGKGSAKLPSSNSNSSHKPMIHVSLSRGEEIKLNESKDPWKPLRLKKENLNEDDYKTEELYKKFRGILNKLTPQKFDTLLERVRTLDINTHKRLEGVIDLVFEKAIEEPNFSVAYANMCHKLSVLKVPAENATNPDQFVNFRALIINKCQSQFEKNKADDQVLKLEKDLSECTDPVKKKEIQIQLNEENRRVRMRSIGNVRFIGELYKLTMLTSKIMVYCMNYLMDKQEEEKLECLCKLLTTIGEQVEREVKEALDMVFKKLQEIVDRRNNNRISSRVRFMIQDVIELRNRKWVGKGVVDLQPKMMDQIQKEAEQHQRHIELMNATPMGYRGGRDDGGRGKRGDGRRQNSFMDNSNNWKTSRNNYTVEISKLKAATGPKIIANTKLAPNMAIWNQGSGAKTTSQTASNSMGSLTKTNNKYSLLDTQTDPTPLRPSKDTNMSSNYHSKGASIERSTFDSRGDFTSGSGGRSGSMNVGRSNSSSRSPLPAAAPAAPAPAPAPPAPREPLPEAKKKTVKAMVDLFVLNPVEDYEDLVSEIKQLYPPQYHADVVNEIFNNIIEKSMKEIDMFSKILLHLVTTTTISVENFLAALKDLFEISPDLHIDIPMLYEYIARILVPQIEKKHITLEQIFGLSDSIIAANHGNLFLKSIIANLKENMGPTFAKSKWQESGLQLKQWMREDQVPKWIEDNKFEFLEGGSGASEETKKILSPAETQAMLLQLMNSDENCECIRGWVQDKLGEASNADWFMRALIQAICEHALFGAEGRDVPHFNLDRMNKYSRLINDFGSSQQARESSCLFGIQQIIHRLEHPQGLTLEIFQYLHDQYIISPDGFIAWESSEMEPEGKGVMIKALTSFFTNIKEVDNEDSCSED